MGGAMQAEALGPSRLGGRGLHSFSFQLNVSAFYSTGVARGVV